MNHHKSSHLLLLSFQSIFLILQTKTVESLMVHHCVYAEVKMEKSIFTYHMKVVLFVDHVNSHFVKYVHIFHTLMQVPEKIYYKDCIDTRCIECYHFSRLGNIKQSGSTESLLMHKPVTEMTHDLNTEFGVQI